VPPSGTSTRFVPRVLILTASVGEGHDLPARTLAAQLRSEQPTVEVVTADGLAPMGRLITWISADTGRLVFFRFQWLWDVGFWFFAVCRPTRAFTQALLTKLGGAGLMRLIERVDPDVIVSTYPNTTEVLGRLRSSRRILVPVCSAITDLSALRYWANPGIDVHLVAYPQSVDEVRKIAGQATRVFTVQGLTAPEFLTPRAQVDARRELNLPAGKVVLVSGGGWGVGDFESAVQAGLAQSAVTCVVCLCGRNVGLETRLSNRFSSRTRVRVVGFTDQMSEWMAAADVLVHSTGGLTVLEAVMRGLPAISYGWGRGHLRLNNSAFTRFALAEVVLNPDRLSAAMQRALARERAPVEEFRTLPSAASFVLAAAQAGGGSSSVQTQAADGSRSSTAG
jgi:processive 1,2-diacylglycerol beta-glucosyltransferase